MKKTIFTGAATPLTLARTENTLITSTDFARIKAYKKAGVLYLYFNGGITGSKTTSDFTEVGRISGWNAAYDIIQGIPAQSTSHSVIVLQVTSGGIIKIYVSGTSLNAWYRASVSVPEA